MRTYTETVNSDHRHAVGAAGRERLASNRRPIILKDNGSSGRSHAVSSHRNSNAQRLLQTQNFTFARQRLAGAERRGRGLRYRCCARRHARRGDQLSDSVRGAGGKTSASGICSGNRVRPDGQSIGGECSYTCAYGNRASGDAVDREDDVADVRGAGSGADRSRKTYVLALW